MDEDICWQELWPKEEELLCCCFIEEFWMKEVVCWSWLGADLKPACWNGVPILGSGTSSWKLCIVLDSIEVFMEDFMEVEVVSALEKLTAPPRCSDLNSPETRFLMAASKPIGITLMAPAKSFPRICDLLGSG